MESILTKIIDVFIDGGDPVVLILFLVVGGLCYLFFKVSQAWEKEREEYKTRITTLEDRNHTLSREYSDKLEKVQDKYQANSDNIKEILIRISAKLFG